MSVYVDTLRPCVRSQNWRHRESCHMIADSESELISFAEKIGLDRDWIQKPGTPEAHFDLSPWMQSSALRNGAMHLDIRDFVRIITEKKIKAREGMEEKNADYKPTSEQ